MAPVKPKKTSGWCCGYCNMIYRDRAFAMVCCRCRKCDQQSQYTGTGLGFCTVCEAELEAAQAKDNLQSAQERLKRAELGLAKGAR